MGQMKRALSLGIGLLLAGVVLGCSPQLGQLGGVAVAADGSALGFVEVRLGRQTTTTNAQGQYWFADIPPGSYRFVAAAAGFHPHEAVLEVRAGPQRLDLVLFPEPVEGGQPDAPPPAPVPPAAPLPVEAVAPAPAPAETPLPSQPHAPAFLLPLPGGYDWLLSTEPGGGFYGGDPNPGHTGRSHFALDIIDNNRQQGELNGFPVPILAAADGVVVEARNTVVCQGCEFGYGNYAKLDHGGGFTTIYGHLRYPSVTVRVGERVRQGQVLGFMGSTGHSTGIHLHFEIRYLNEGIKQAAVLNAVLVDGVALAAYKVGTVARPKYYHSSQQLP